MRRLALRSRFRPRGEAGFTLVELMITVAMLGVGTAWITQLFISTWQTWKHAMDELILQRNLRNAMSFMTRAIREASTGSVVIDSPAGQPQFSSISFTDGRGNWWWFKQTGRSLYAVHGSGTKSTTDMLASNVEMTSFLYPSFQNVSLIDVGLCGRILPYARAPAPIIIQLSERVRVRNP